MAAGRAPGTRSPAAERPRGLRRYTAGTVISETAGCSLGTRADLVNDRPEGENEPCQRRRGAVTDQREQGNSNEKQAGGGGERSHQESAPGVPSTGQQTTMRKRMHPVTRVAVATAARGAAGRSFPGSCRSRDKTPGPGSQLDPAGVQSHRRKEMTAGRGATGGPPAPNPPPASKERGRCLSSRSPTRWHSPSSAVAAYTWRRSARLSWGTVGRATSGRSVTHAGSGASARCGGPGVAPARTVAGRGGDHVALLAPQVDPGELPAAEPADAVAHRLVRRRGQQVPPAAAGAGVERPRQPEPRLTQGTQAVASPGVGVDVDDDDTRAGRQRSQPMAASTCRAAAVTAGA